MIQRYEAAKASIARLEEVRTQHKVRDGNIRKFLKALSMRDNLATEFDEDFWHITVDYVTVYSGGRYSFALKDGRTVEWG